ncbi:hypothetical protein BRADI_3g49491v3 [Brachypodium distachyon]|uniref:Uncharacterized protein n=1 Tax=Brachypodium distachyon TaxID=15368 RepID=A0A2K2D4A3_BRADI|nr:hypothetical protein BRADI_3g49491v3 [Brachypodium distachyon]
MKLSLTTGIIPSLNISAGLLGFFFARLWAAAEARLGLRPRPFTRQENTVIQTCVVAAYGIAFSGGFRTYMFGMSSRIADQATEAKGAMDIKDPSLGWMIGFLFLVCFVGLFALVPLRKVMIMDYGLSCPSGTATATLINGFHTPQGAKEANFLFGFFKWFYTAGDDCGFESFPSLGLEAYQRKFYFSFSPIYVGVGMICPYIINVSVLIGGILSWGLMWPLIETKKGSWYPATATGSNLHGLQGYKVFISIAMILGDGFYNFLKVTLRMVRAFMAASRKRSALPVSGDGGLALVRSFDEKRRAEFFLKDQIPLGTALAGYVAVAAVSIGVVPKIFPQLKWYYILVAYGMAPVLAFCNAYGMGLTDWSLATTYGKLGIFIFGAWAGASHGGVIAGLAACGVMMTIVTTAADLMQDFKTGYMTLASPKSMFISQVIGTAMVCVIGPCVFWLFYKAFVYRNMAILGVNGFSSLPKHCLTLCYGMFAVAVLVNLVRDLVPEKVSRFIPVPMAMAIPFYLGSYFAIDMCVGSAILFVWEKVNKTGADMFAPSVASGLICGEGIWSMPQSVLALAKVEPPICMKFLSRPMNARVDAFIQTLSSKA